MILNIMMDVQVNLNVSKYLAVLLERTSKPQAHFFVRQAMENPNQML